MKYAMLAFVMVACCTTMALADSWVSPNELMKKEFAFGESKVILEIDGTKSQSFPPYTMSIYAGNQMVAKYKNIGFDRVYPSKDNKFFVGVSNRGIPGTAFVVFDAEGSLLREVKHRFLPEAIYTAQTIILVRVWFNEQKPDVEFDISDGRLLAVFIRGSNNQRYNLLERDLDFRNVPAER